jgi:hypothetical protein
MSGSGTSTTTIRGAIVDGHDGARINRLAALSGSRAPEGAILLAETDGEPVAAIGIFDRHAVSDRSRSTLALRVRLQLLRVPLRVILSVYGI